MIKPEQVPPEVAAALKESIRTMSITGWAEAAIAAALNAWPDARIRTTFLPNDDGVWIVPQHMWSLPLTEASDD